MTFLKKMHELSIHALNACAMATLVSLTFNILTAVCLYWYEHRKPGSPQQ